MSTVALRPMKVVGNWFSGSGMNQYVETRYKNKASAAFKSGEILTLDATPELIRAASIVGSGDDRIDVSLVSAVATVANQNLRLYGLALKDAAQSGTGQDYIPVATFVPGVVLEGNLVTATAGDGDAPAALALTAAHLGSSVAIVYDSTLKQWYFTPTIVTTTERLADIIKIGIGIGGDTLLGGIGDSNARVQVVLRADVMRMFCLNSQASQA